MRDVPETLRLVLRTFCHMEWYETHELRAMIRDGTLHAEMKTLISEFQSMLDDAILQAYITPAQFAEITSDDCESNAEVVVRLERIRNEVFPRPSDQQAPPDDS